jgi:hypothetical protein
MTTKKMTQNPKPCGFSAFNDVDPYRTIPSRILRSAMTEKQTLLIWSLGEGSRPRGDDIYPPNSRSYGTSSFS